MMTDTPTATFDQTVNRRIVHRASNASVLLTSIHRLRSDTWLAGAQIPRARLLGRHSTGRAVPLLFGVEVLRQCGLAVAHAGLGVPLGHSFTMSDLSFAWSGDGVPEYPAFGPIEAEARVEATDVIHRRGEITGIRLRLNLRAEDRDLAEGGGLLRCLTPAQYRALRRHAPHPEEVPQRNDRSPLRTVRTHPHRLEARLGWNHQDPFTFDHATDHLPGMALMHSAINASERLTGAPLCGLSMEFSRFAEFTPTPRLQAITRNPAVVEVTINQADHIAATGACLVAS